MVKTAPAGTREEENFQRAGQDVGSTSEFDGGDMVAVALESRERLPARAFLLVIGHILVWA